MDEIKGAFQFADEKNHGRIYKTSNEDDVKRNFDFTQCSEKDYLRMKANQRVLPTQEQIMYGKVEKDDICPCGSKKKFKNCCSYLSKSVRKDLWLKICKRNENV